jgi:hypothetical protein
MFSKAAMPEVKRATHVVRWAVALWPIDLKRAMPRRRFSRAI